MTTPTQYGKIFLWCICGMLFFLSAFGGEIRKYDVLILKLKGSRLEGNVVIKGKKVYFTSKGKNIHSVYKKEDVEKIIWANPPKAVYFQRTKKLSLADYEGRLELAKFCFQYELKVEAEKELKKCLFIQPKKENAYQMLSDFYSQKRRAWQELPLVKQDAKKIEALLNQELSIYRLAKKNQIQNAIFAYRSAILYKNLQAYLLAEKYAKNALKWDKNSFSKTKKIDLQILLGEIYLGLQKEKKALQMIDKITVDKETTWQFKARIFKIRGAVYVYLGKIDLAIEAYENLKSTFKGKEWNFQKIFPSTILGTLYFLKGKKFLKKGEDHLKDALTFSKDIKEKENANILAYLSLICTNQGKFEEANEYLEQAQGEKNTLQEDAPLLGQAYLFFARGENKKANQVYEKLAKISKNGFILFLIGSYYLQIGNLTKGKDCFEKALKFKFSPPDILYILATIASKEKKYDKALRFLKYIQHNLDEVTFSSQISKSDFFYTLGSVYLQKKEWSLAQESFQKSLKLNKDHLSTLNGLAYISYQQAQESSSFKNRQDYLKKSKSYLSQTIAKNSKNEYANRLLGKIAEITQWKMWEDLFRRPNAPRPYNNWKVEAKSGIEVKIQEHHMVFEGEQAVDNQETIASRVVSSSDFTKFEVTFQVQKESFQQSSTSLLEYGIVLNGQSPSFVSKLRVFATSKGVFYHEARSNGKTSSIKILPLPKNGKFKFAISIDDSSKKFARIEVNNLYSGKIPISFSSLSESLSIQIYGKSSAKKKWKMSVSKVRIFKKR